MEIELPYYRAARKGDRKGPRPSSSSAPASTKNDLGSHFVVIVEAGDGLGWVGTLAVAFLSLIKSIPTSSHSQSIL